MPECKKCGRCCVEKFIVGDDVYLTPYHCKYLDLDTRLCTVYDRRESLDVECLSVKEGIKNHVFPADCSYVEGLTDYQPPRDDWWTDPDVAQLVEDGDFEGDVFPPTLFTEDD